MKRIILCPFSFEKNLLTHYRENNPFVDLKFVDKESLLRAHFGCFKKGSLLAIMKHFNLSYSMASIYLKFLPYVKDGVSDSVKVDAILKAKKYLIDNGFYIYDHSLLDYLNGKIVSVVGYSARDFQLFDILKENNISFEYAYVEDIEDRQYMTFDTAEDEIHHLLISICDQIKNGRSLNDIYIYGMDDAYEELFKRYATLYGVPVNGLSQPLLKEYAFGKLFFKNYINSKDYEQSLALCDEIYEKDPDYIVFKQSLQENYDEELSFDQQVELFNAKVKVSNESPIYDNAVTIIKDLTYFNDKLIYVVGFSQGKFPPVQTDKEFLTDNIKEQFKIPTSKQENLIKKDEMLSFFKSNNQFIFSMSFKVGLNVKYESFLKEALELVADEPGIPHYDYCETAATYELVKMQDLGRKYREVKKEYTSYKRKLKLKDKKYDNQYDFVECVDNDTPLYHSYSSLNKYINCPFSYYLGNILKIEDFEEHFSAKFGTCAHAVLQRCLSNFQLDFDEVFDEEVERQEFSIKDRLFAYNLKEQIETTLLACRNHLASLDFPKVLFEQKVTVPLATNSYLMGFIDKAIITDDKWISIIDYKSGKYNPFSKEAVEKGIALQLPTYGLLARKDPTLKQYQIGGLYIQQIVNDDFVKGKEDPESPTLLKLKGKPLANVDYIHSIDPSYFTGQCKFINIRPNKDLNSLPKRSTIEEEEFKDCIRLVRDHFVRVDKEIRCCNFPIKPMLNGSISGCQYCPFKDICYVKPDQFREIETKRSKKDGDELE